MQCFMKECSSLTIRSKEYTSFNEFMHLLFPLYPRRQYCASDVHTEDSSSPALVLSMYPLHAPIVQPNTNTNKCYMQSYIPQPVT